MAAWPTEFQAPLSARMVHVMEDLAGDWRQLGDSPGAAGGAAGGFQAARGPGQAQRSSGATARGEEVLSATGTAGSTRPHSATTPAKWRRRQTRGRSADAGTRECGDFGPRRPRFDAIFAVRLQSGYRI